MSAAVSLAAAPVLPTAPEAPARKGERDGAYLRGYVYLVGANLGAKAAGIVRELAVAALFGTSPALGLYVLLKSGLEAASVTATGAFQLSLVPRLVRLAREGGGDVDVRALFADALRVGALAAVLSVTVMLGALAAAGHALADVAVLTVLLSLSLGLLLVGVVGMVGHQAGGRFGKMSGAYLLTAVLMASFVYPLGRWFGIEGLALTWLVAVTAQASLVWGPTLRAAPRVEAGHRANLFVPALLKGSDFRPAVLVAGNQMVLSLIIVRLLASLGGLEAVAVVNYALVLSGLFVTTVARNMSS
ncbi:MAG TPA: hypothetical protein VK610_08445, partial [Rhodothermales bacterium]|nr:hypothetical protein [Rhodothermales bacterium]